MTDGSHLRMSVLHRFLKQRDLLNCEAGEGFLREASHFARNDRINVEASRFLPGALAVAFELFAGGEEEQYAAIQNGSGF